MTLISNSKYSFAFHIIVNVLYFFPSKPFCWAYHELTNNRRGIRREVVRKTFSFQLIHDHRSIFRTDASKWPPGGASGKKKKKSETFKSQYLIRDTADSSSSNLHYIRNPIHPDRSNPIYSPIARHITPSHGNSRTPRFNGRFSRRLGRRLIGPIAAGRQRERSRRSGKSSRARRQPAKPLLGRPPAVASHVRRAFTTSPLCCLLGNYCCSRWHGIFESVFFARIYSRRVQSRLLSSSLSGL